MTPGRARKSKSQPSSACKHVRRGAVRRSRARSAAAARPKPLRRRAISASAQAGQLRPAVSRRIRSPSRTSAQRPADAAFRAYMQHAGAVARAAHARIGDAHHVANARLEQLLRDRQHAPFRHARCADRPASCSTSTLSGVTSGRDRRCAPAGPVVTENHRRAGMLQQPRFGGGALQHRAARRQVPRSTTSPPAGYTGLSSGRMTSSL